MLHAARRARDMIDCEASESLAGAVLELSDDATDRADALVLLAHAAQMRGDREAVARYTGAAFTLARESDNPTVLVRTVHVLADHHTRGTNAELVAIVERAYERVKDAGTTSELVEAVWALCRERRYEDPASLIDVADEALTLARGLASATPLLQALHARAIVGQAALEEIDRVIEWCEEGVAVARRDRNPNMLALHQGALVHSLMQCGRFDEAQLVQAELDRAADASNSRVFRWNTDVRSASFLLVQDRLDEAGIAIDRAGEFGATLGDARPAEEYASQVGILHLARDQFGSLRPLLAGQAASNDAAIWQWALALSDAVNGDLAAARHQYGTIDLPDSVGPPPHWLWLAELATAAEVALRCHDAVLGSKLATLIEPHLHHHVVFGVTLSLGSIERAVRVRTRCGRAYRPGAGRARASATVERRRRSGAVGASFWRRAPAAVRMAA